MGKKEIYFVLAEKYYVEEQLPISGIANRLNITEKTLHGWKKEGEWENKKMKFLQSQYSCYSGLYELVNKMTQKMIEDFETSQEMPDGATLYFIKSMADKLPKLKKFETEMITDKNNQEVKEKEFSEDIIKKIHEHMINGG